MHLIVYLFYKVFIVTLLLLLSPIMLFLSILILVSSGFPIFFRQKRIGEIGNIFTFYKFRTMQVGAEKLRYKLQSRNEADGPVFKIHSDPRFTGIGRFLSHTGLDELPQLVNVLKGEMAFFGPRPLPVYEAKKLKPWQKARQRIKPGIISPWIINGYHSQTFDNWMKSDIAYTAQKSLFYDTVLLFKTSLFLRRLLMRELMDFLRR